MTPEAFRALALSMAGSHEEPHFERTSFRIGKRIFATMTPDGLEVMVPVHPPMRALALIESKPSTYLGYGGFTTRNGALGVRLARANDQILEEFVREACARIAPKMRSSAKGALSTRRVKRRPK